MKIKREKFSMRILLLLILVINIGCTQNSLKSSEREIEGHYIEFCEIRAPKSEYCRYIDVEEYEKFLETLNGEDRFDDYED
jgi:hypothetical protein